MIVVGFDTATPATAVAVLSGDDVRELRDDPLPGARPAHASRLLALIAEAMSAAGVAWPEVDRIAVGVGPGTFTGLRIGLATARSLAHARGLPLAPVSTLEALAAPLRAQAERVAAVLDARRGEVFAAAWEGDRQTLAPAALAPEALAERLKALGAPLAAGDGAIRFREQLEPTGAAIPADGSPLHRVSAAWTCRLGVTAEPSEPGAVLPAYLREPDAQPRPRGRK